jgi:hypothetical protein
MPAVGWLRPSILPSTEPRVLVSELHVVHTLFSASAVCVSANALVVTTGECERQRVVVNCACSLRHEMQSIGIGIYIFHLMVRAVAALGSERALQSMGVTLLTVCCNLLTHFHNSVVQH